MSEEKVEKAKECKYFIEDIPTYEFQEGKLKTYTPEEQDIIDILVKSFRIAREKKLSIIKVKGSFRTGQLDYMKKVMKKKYYFMWKSEEGYMFIPHVAYIESESDKVSKNDSGAFIL